MKMAMPTKRNNINDFIILALDFDTWEDAKQAVELIGDEGTYYKVGMRLFFSGGFPAIEWLKKNNKRVFLDLKLNDIPATIHGAVKQLSQKGVDMITVYGDRNTALAAAEATKDSTTKAINVTVLTSESGSGFTTELVMDRTSMTIDAGLDGVVCSGWETLPLRDRFGEDFLIINPGIRLDRSQADDQKRVVTPVQARDSGASHIVIGRPVFTAPDPLAALKEIKNTLADS